MTKIKIIIPYFGTFPPQFKFWWASALNNPNVGFLLVTDNKNVKTEANIQVVQMSFAECQVRVQKLFPFKVALASPYKLCDFKPCYSLIFSDLLDEVDFVGWGDLDLIYGDIRSFITEEVLAQYDMISGWGHLTLLRNNDYWRHFFELQVDGFQCYKEVYQSPKSFGFDEYWHGGLSDKAMSLHPNKVWDPRPFDDLRTPESNRNFCSSSQRLYKSDHLMFQYQDKQMWRIYLLGDKIYKEPTMYMHFKRRQKLLKVCTDNTENYLVIPNRIIDEEPLTLRKVYHWTHCGHLCQYGYTLKCKVVRKLKKIFHV